MEQGRVNIDFIQRTNRKKYLTKYVEMLMTVKNNEIETLIEEYSTYKEKKQRGFDFASNFDKAFRSFGLGAFTCGSAIGLVASGAPLGISLMLPIGTYTAVGISNSIIASINEKDREYKSTVREYKKRIDELDKELFLYTSILHYLKNDRETIRRHIEMYLKDESIDPFYYYEFEGYVENDSRLNEIVVEMGREEKIKMDELMLDLYIKITQINPNYDFPDDIDLRELYSIYRGLTNKVKRYN